MSLSGCLLVLVFSHDSSMDTRYQNLDYYKQMEQKGVEFYTRAGVEYRLVKYNATIDTPFQESGNNFYIKGIEAYDFETCNYKDRVAFTYYYKKYKYLYKSTLTALPNIRILHDIISHFGNQGKDDVCYCGPVYNGHGKFFVGGFAMLLNSKAIDIILSKEWTTNDDESIGDILRDHIIRIPCFANHYHQDSPFVCLDKTGVAKFVSYKETKNGEPDFILHDLISAKFLQLLNDTSPPQQDYTLHLL
jgi:hypothetical protein